MTKISAIVKAQIIERKKREGERNGQLCKSTCTESAEKCTK